MYWAVSAAAFVVAPPLLGGAAEPPGAPPPGIKVVLRPHATGGSDSYVGVQMTLLRPDVAAGQILVHMPLKIVGIPTARYDGDAISAADAQGPLRLTAEDEPPTPQWIYRDWKIARATVGDVVLTYHAPPRQVTAATNNGPLFDLREEAGGFAGAGIGFLALPTREGPWRIHLKWDLSDAPAGSRGESSLGDGEVELIAPAETLGYSYYMVGPLRSIPERNDGKFGLYWLGDPPFDVAALGQRIRTLYTTMATFFHDTGSSYRVFMRQNPYEGTGGSGLGRSFMFGYNPAAKPTVDALQGLLAHETAHNWPAMQGEHGDTAWYSEGTAEYYSLLLSSRAGLLSTPEFLSSINEKARAYYQNPYLRLTNSQAAKIFWTDPTAQTVPYGRGFMYLQITDGAIRARSGGKRSLDDVVLELYQRKVNEEPYGIPQWLELVGKQIGAREARRAYEAMVAGAVEVPSSSRFAPCFKVVRRSTRKFELGFSRSSLNDDRVVRDLIAGSAAAKAGIQNGDTVTHVTGMIEATRDDSKTISLSFKHDGVENAVSYLPRGQEVSGYGWTLNPRAAGSGCVFPVR
jgi:hypothetical protein